MNNQIIKLIAQELSIRDKQVTNTILLIDEGCTVPFISRYRKEMTDSLDEVQVAEVCRLYELYKVIEKRKETILKTIEEQGLLTDKLATAIKECFDANKLEDLYLPYKPKRRTKATIAREKGLEPLAKTLFSQNATDIDSACLEFINDDVDSAEDALQGARDIIAEWVSEDGRARDKVRGHFRKEAVVYSKLVKGKEEEGEKYQDYFDFEERLSKIPSHRLLAIMRGMNEGILRVSLSPDDENTLESLNRQFIKGRNQASKQVEMAVADGYKRLVKPSIENEFSKLAKETADKESIDVFRKNLQQLLLAAPLGQQRILAIDPGFRTGCKLVCLNENGDLLHNENIYPHPPKSDVKKAASKVSQLVATYKIDAIAIGNGTASRETEQFIKNVKFNQDVAVFIVSENGASIYSASKTAREEFPEYDVTVRGAVSIGRRLMDPLAELVKIDPKSIGVGQYQHDVDQSKLQSSLTETVELCVNKVGVELNTASKHILTYISGLGPSLAENIVKYRTENGPFKSRKELLKVPRMGKRAFEQSAGFLRIRNAKNPLDNSAVHPESYAIVEKIAKDHKSKIEDLLSSKELRSKVALEKYVTEKVGLPTLNDIMKELEKPGRDPRDQIKVFSFDESLSSIDDLQVGMTVPGIVNNVTNFGAFVDIGIKENGLIHISNICDRFISSPAEVLSLHQHVMVKVLEIDMQRKRIQLSMKGIEQSV